MVSRQSGRRRARVRSSSRPTVNPPPSPIDRPLMRTWREGPIRTRESTVCRSSCRHRMPVVQVTLAMRVLHVTSSIDPTSGGTSMAVLGLARAQAEAGLNVTLLTTERRGTSAQFVDAHGVATHIVAPGTGKLVRHPEFPHVARQLVAAADVVHVHALFEDAQYQATRAARSRGVPY